MIGTVAEVPTHAPKVRPCPISVTILAMARTYREQQQRGCGCTSCFTRIMVLAVLVAVGGYVGLHYAYGGTTEGLVERVRVAPWMDEAPERVTTLARQGAALFQKLLDSLGGEVSEVPSEGAKGAIQVFFAPVKPEQEDGLDDILVELIRGAKHEVDLACYELGLPEVTEALVDQHFAGVSVRIVTDSRYANREMMQRCLDEGLDVTFDRREPYMHNKFVVVDGRWVWTGSANLTRNGMYRNNNNALLIDAVPLAENYSVEFEEMVSGQFGGRSPRNTPNPILRVGGVDLECYFAPEDDVQAEIIAEIDAADDSILVMAFAFTSRPIAEAMARRIAAGTRVRALFEKRNAGSVYSRDDYLAVAGAEIYLDANEYSMHHKVIVVDRETVITGSYNFSKNAETRNDENVLILHDADLARSYAEEFDRIAPRP